MALEGSQLNCQSQFETNTKWSPEVDLLINCAVIQNNTTREEEEKQYIYAQVLAPTIQLSASRLYRWARLDLPHWWKLEQPIDLTQYTRDRIPSYLLGVW